ncbi:MAG: cation diffusion facilitator family transporter [Pseudonocardiales bacterium]|nr:cation diffusion facilitator family transporter [Pseudonocardiales bacterium]
MTAESAATGHAHSHAPPVPKGRADRRWLLMAAAIVAVFLVAEAIVGFAIGSLALLSDAGHMLSDAGALLVAVLASKIAERPARDAYTYGFARVDALSGQANGITLLLLAVWFVVEAVRRLIDPSDVPGLAIVITAAIGIVVNILATMCANKAASKGLNVRGAVAHLVNDIWAFAATLVAGVIIIATGWTRADAIASLLVAALMAWSGWGLIKASGRVFLEAAPAGVHPMAVGAALAAIPGVREIHDLHIWDLGAGQAALSAHVIVDPGRSCHAVADEVRELLEHRFEITHATLQSEHADRMRDDGGDPECVDTHGPIHHSS